MIDKVYEVGVEDIEPDHWVAYIFNLFGCFSSATSQHEALNGVEMSLHQYRDWLSRRWTGQENADFLFEEPAFSLQFIEEFHSFPAPEDPTYIVNAFFNDDARPLMFGEIREALGLLDYSRKDLLSLTENLSVDELNISIADDHRFGSIAAILKHIAVTEWWYCDRLGLVEDWHALPEDPLRALETSRANTYFRLPELADDPRIVELVGEHWSARKLVRRTLWHERDHTEHIRKLIPTL